MSHQMARNFRNGSSFTEARRQVGVDAIRVDKVLGMISSKLNPSGVSSFCLRTRIGKAPSH